VQKTGGPQEAEAFRFLNAFVTKNASGETV